MSTPPRFIFFGTPDFSVRILSILKDHGYIPTLIVTAPDRKVGRKQVVTAPPVAQWAQDQNIPLLQTDTPNDHLEELKKHHADLFIVAAYGYILSKKLIDIPTHGTLNVHTSLLPLYRGACPIESAILNGDELTGSTIMLMDHKMDHGPIINQEAIALDQHTNRIELFDILADHGGQLLAHTIEPWMNGEITEQRQHHDQAQYCQKIQKSDGDISHDNDEQRYRKYLAYYGWPGVFYFDDQGKRIKVTKARYEDGHFIIERIIPEGKQEQEV
jgi:methionyl-tRNA formyltransferase